MTKKHFFILLGLISLVLVPLSRADDGSVGALKFATQRIKKEKDRLAVQSALDEFAESSRVASYFGDCYGCVVFPTIGKGGFGVGGAHGKGWVFRNNGLTGESKMTQVTVGFQAGGQAFRQVIFFEDEAAFRRFTSGKFEFGAQASAVAITEGANASTSTAGGSNAGAGNVQTKRGYSDGMAVFTKTKGGLMYEAALGGQKFSFKKIE